MAGGNAGKGRPKGSVNKHPTRDVLVKVFKELGGIDGMVQWAKENQEAFYTRLWAKMVPTEVAGKIEHEVTHVHAADADTLAPTLQRHLAARTEPTQPSVH